MLAPKTRPSGRLLRTVALTLAAALVVGACSGGADDASSAPDVSSTTTTEAATTTTAPATGEIAGGPGVDSASKTITLGVLADLSGDFASLTTDVVDAHTVFWDEVNAAGGIDGWTVDIEVADTRADVDRHREQYVAMRDNVLAISQSTGSSANVASLDLYIEDEMLVVPMSWYSGWPFLTVDRGVILEQNTNYCIEAMNIVGFASSMGATSLAIVTLDDVYGRDAAAGAAKAADFYGMGVVYDGTGAVVSADELADVIGAIVDSSADWTFLATNPSLSAQIIAGAVRFGYQGMFAGAVPSYDSRLLDSASAELFGTRYYQSAYSVGWGDAAPGNIVMMSAMAEAFPDRRPSDAFIIGWNAANAMRSVLEAAIAADDLTRAGVVEAANSIDQVTFGGSAPDQSYAGVPNDFVNRQSAIYKPNLEAYAAAGGINQTLSQTGATTGSVLVQDFAAGAAASE
ncbi:MAG: ABC transporter substrate-binding protein, partial [Acidimicrobiia bacterium]